MKTIFDTLIRTIDVYDDNVVLPVASTDSVMIINHTKEPLNIQDPGQAWKISSKDSLTYLCTPKPVDVRKTAESIVLVFVNGLCSTDELIDRIVTLATKT